MAEQSLGYLRSALPKSPHTMRFSGLLPASHKYPSSQGHRCHWDVTSQGEEAVAAGGVTGWPWCGSQKHRSAEGHQRASVRLKIKSLPPPWAERAACLLPPASCLDGEDTLSCTPVDLQLSFPDTVAVMGSAEVTKLLKPACLPFINVTFKAPSAQVNHKYISRSLWYIPSP